MCCTWNIRKPQARKEYEQPSSPRNSLMPKCFRHTLAYSYAAKSICCLRERTAAHTCHPLFSDCRICSDLTVHRAAPGSPHIGRHVHVHCMPVESVRASCECAFDNFYRNSPWSMTTTYIELLGFAEMHKHEDNVTFGYGLTHCLRCVFKSCRFRA
jgi:hypothetical protein